ncbi:MAG: hypothetical protein IPH75_15300 [bacterium]|nr:hypothetical protein [bacterium]
MLIGHFGVALGLKRFAPTINLIWLSIAATGIDLLLWILVLAGVETVITPENYGQLHYLQFIFPFSHSLAGVVAYSILFAILGYLFTRRSSRAVSATVMFIAMFSHWVLDFLVHPEQLPLVGETSPKVGLGLWNTLPAALALEALIFVIGLIMYYRGTRPKNNTGRFGPAILFVIVAIVSLVGQAVSSTPVESDMVAGSSLGLLLIVIFIGGWMDASRRPLRN